MQIGTQDVAPDDEATTDTVQGREGGRAWLARSWAVLRGPRAAALFFGAYLLVALPLLVLSLGRYMWFFRDDWFFLTDRELTDPGSLFEPHNGHWSTVPVVVFRVLYRVFGLDSYRPYQAAVVVAHLGVCLMVRVVMRRVGVGPWLATVLAGLLVLLGFGREDIVWGFQVGFTGAMFFALLQLVLADHDGPIDRRDLLALGAGCLAVMSASPALPLVVMGGAALLVRRGWRAAAVQTVPLGVGYLLWRTIAGAEQSSPFGRPSVDVVVDWLRSGAVGAFEALAGGRAVLGWTFALMLVGGTALSLWQPVPGEATNGAARVAEARRLAVPLCLMGSAVVFMLLSVQARWIAGPQAAAAGRYSYFYAAVTLPALAVGVTALARRWRPLGLGVGLLVVGLALPANVAAFDDAPFGPSYHEQRRLLITSATRMPWADRAPADVRPVNDPFVGEDLDLGFLRDAVSSGRLTPATGAIPAWVRSELYVRLGTRQGPAKEFPSSCEPLTGRVRVRPEVGSAFIVSGDVRVWSFESGKRAPVPAVVRAAEGNRLEVATKGLDLELQAFGPGSTVCRIA